MTTNGQEGIGRRESSVGERFKSIEWLYGYHDARAGLGYRAKYETWKPYLQRQYRMAG